MKSTFRAIAAVLAAALSVTCAGCGKPKNSASQDGKTTIVLWDSFPQGDTEAELAIREFYDKKVAEKFPNLIIREEATSGGGDYLANYDKALMAGTAPTAFSNIPYVNIPSRMEDGTIADITDLYKDWQYKDKSIENPSFSGGEVIVFNPKASKTELKAAFDYMTYIFYDEDYLCDEWKVRNEYNIGSIQMPARKDLYEQMLNTYDSVPQGLKQDVLALSKIAHPEPACPNWNDIKNALVEPLQAIMLDQSLTRDKAQKLLNDCAEKLYDTYPDSFEK